MGMVYVAAPCSLTRKEPLKGTLDEANTLFWVAIESKKKGKWGARTSYKTLHVLIIINSPKKNGLSQLKANFLLSK